MADTARCESVELEDVIPRYWRCISWAIDQARELPTPEQRYQHLWDIAVEGCLGFCGPGQMDVATRWRKVYVWAPGRRASRDEPDHVWTMRRFIKATMAYYSLDGAPVQSRLPGL